MYTYSYIHVYMWGRLLFVEEFQCRKQRKCCRGTSKETIALAAPWALVGRALVPPWALMVRALMGRALMGQALMDQALVRLRPKEYVEATF